MAQGMNFQEYNIYVKRFSAFKNLMEERRKMPEH